MQTENSTICFKRKIYRWKIYRLCIDGKFVNKIRTENSHMFVNNIVVWRMRKIQLVTRLMYLENCVRYVERKILIGVLLGAEYSVSCEI